MDVGAREEMVADMNERTPGPWHFTYLSAGEVGVCAEGRGLILNISNAGKRIRNGMADFEEEGNARLIAAAPAVLDALLDLTALYAASPGHDPNFVKKAQAAIAKAQGTAP